MNNRKKDSVTQLTNLNVFISNGEKDSGKDPSTLVWEPVSFHEITIHKNPTY